MRPQSWSSAGTGRTRSRSRSAAAFTAAASNSSPVKSGVLRPRTDHAGRFHAGSAPRSTCLRTPRLIPSSPPRSVPCAAVAFGRYSGARQRCAMPTRQVSRTSRLTETFRQTLQTDLADRPWESALVRRRSSRPCHDCPFLSWCRVRPAQATHGATFVVDAAFIAEELDGNGIVVDIGRAHDVLKAILAPLNYRNLGEIPGIQRHQRRPNS